MSERQGDGSGRDETPIGEDRIDRGSKVVTRLLAWVALQSDLSPDVRYEMSRHDAAVLLEQLAGCRAD